MNEAVGCDLLRIHAQLLDDDILHLFFNRFIRHKKSSIRVDWRGKVKAFRAQDGK